MHPQQSIRARAGLPLLVCHAAKVLNRPERTIRHWAQTGRLRGGRLGVKIWAFEEAEVERVRIELGALSEACGS